MKRTLTQIEGSGRGHVTRSRTRLATLSCCRIAQMCLGFSGALGPMRRPAFQGRRGMMKRSDWRMANLPRMASLPGQILLLFRQACASRRWQRPRFQTLCQQTTGGQEMSGFTDEERRADVARRAAEEARRDASKRNAQTYRPGAKHPVCMICNLQFPSHQTSTPDTPICLSCF